MYVNHFSVLPINRIEIFSIYYFCCLQLTSRPRQLSSTPAAGSLLAAGHTQPQSAVRRHRYSTAQCVRRNGGDVGGGGGGGGEPCASLIAPVELPVAPGGSMLESALSGV
uniref:Uncharacterized protein n=1 Tax=Ceratitis capitata TaxID=7213 RepID=W8BHL5_CERCA